MTAGETKSNTLYLEQTEPLFEGPYTGPRPNEDLIHYCIADEYIEDGKIKYIPIDPEDHIADFIDRHFEELIFNIVPTNQIYRAKDSFIDGPIESMYDEHDTKYQFAIVCKWFDKYNVGADERKALYGKEYIATTQLIKMLHKKHQYGLKKEKIDKEEQYNIENLAKCEKNKFVFANRNFKENKSMQDRIDIEARKKESELEKKRELYEREKRKIELECNESDEEESDEELDNEFNSNDEIKKRLLKFEKIRETMQQRFSICRSPRNESDDEDDEEEGREEFHKEDVVELNFDRNSGWTAETATEWAESNGYLVPQIEIKMFVIKIKQCPMEKVRYRIIDLDHKGISVITK